MPISPRLEKKIKFGSIGQDIADEVLTFARATRSALNVMARRLESTLSASTPGKRDSRPRSAQAATAALDWFAFQFQGSRSATLLAR